MDLCVIWAAGVLHMQLVSLSRVNINTESGLLAFSQVFRTDSGLTGVSVEQRASVFKNKTTS